MLRFYYWGISLSWGLSYQIKGRRFPWGKARRRVVIVRSYPKDTDLQMGADGGPLILHHGGSGQTSAHQILRFPTTQSSNTLVELLISFVPRAPLIS